MNRKWLVWTLVPLLSVLLFGCPKKKPVTQPKDLNVETKTVAPPPPPPPAEEVKPRQETVAPDKTENPLLSEDLKVVNDELRRRGFASDVYFAYDEANLSDEAREKLARNSDVLKNQAQFQITIEGHCDERGTSEYNLALGERRANSVRDYMGSLGVNASRMKTISYGKERPVCTQNEESCWAQNRRGHMVVTGRSNVG